MKRTDSEIERLVPQELQWDTRVDVELARAVRHALEWNIFVPHTRISSTVRDGRVTLDGEVEYWSQREEAEKAVHNLDGVHHVTNLIAIKPPKARPNDVRKWIQEALERQADREAERIGIAVADDRVSLSGVVHSWAEREAILGAARNTPGVRSVEDRLEVTPLPSA